MECYTVDVRNPSAALNAVQQVDGVSETLRSSLRIQVRDMMQIDTTGMTLEAQQELQAAMLLADDMERQKDLLASLRVASGVFRPVVLPDANEQEQS